MLAATRTSNSKAMGNTVNKAFFCEDDVTRVYARALLWDKEKLHHEQSQLKRNINSLTDDNLKLRTRIQQLEVFYLWGYIW